jgi:hypothetical protein
MRKAAVKVRKKFGIPRFSHSTISRTFSALLVKADLLSAISEPDTGQSTEITTDLNTPKRSLPEYPIFSERPSWTQGKKKVAFSLFQSLKSLLIDPEDGMILVYQYFKRYCSLLI